MWLCADEKVSDGQLVAMKASQTGHGPHLDLTCLVNSEEIQWLFHSQNNMILCRVEAKCRKSVRTKQQVAFPNLFIS